MSAANTSPSPDLTHEDNNAYLGDDGHESGFANRSCCFWIPCLRSDPSQAGSLWWERIRVAENEDHWWIRGWKKLREWSELVAGPKWKTFIRQFNKNRAGGQRPATFRYDALSYSLNFDEGPGQDDHLSEDFLRRDFSTRFAAIPASAKSSMDLGKDGPSFT